MTNEELQAILARADRWRIEYRTSAIEALRKQIESYKANMQQPPQELLDELRALVEKR